MSVKNGKQLKCWQRHFKNIWSGLKLFEVRQNDRNYTVGDILILGETKDGTEEYTGYSVWAEVVYILDDSAGLKDGYVCMQIKIMKRFYKSEFSDVLEYSEAV